MPEQKVPEHKMPEARIAEHTEIAAAWTDVNQRVLAGLADLSAASAKEGARLMGELQQGALDALRETQTAVIRWQTLWPEALMDPVRWYQKALMETVDGAQRAFDLMTFSTRSFAHSADRIRATAEQTNQQVHDALTAGTARTREAARRVA